ncbi:MAG: methyltransferase domain-containing protein [Thermosynechococcus sp. Uc]|uniref:class I SAM-dependent methyltransferase n=1 Tax=Thermosynechococcus sp. Uc TaxID=3034853 RepID=UPI00259DDCC3|nr:class I SAM-dependent methyltransferase [Thermosynechococcus sp. Uc]MDM7327529.1 methyltransferase domain-containing protein [Thermosynechococcus sp. Uc]
MFSQLLSSLFGSKNETGRSKWLEQKLHSIPPGLRILDAGAGELRNKHLCDHLIYVSQDFCQYDGQGNKEGLHTGNWDTSKVDLVCDITEIPEPDASFDVILCSEVFEHIPDPLKALEEFSRLLKTGGKLILTAPFASLVHFAPYHYATGFSRYWYEYHLPRYGFKIEELAPNGDWFAYLEQELMRLPQMTRQYGDWSWPISYLVSLVGGLYFLLRGKRLKASELACFGWHCLAIRC